MLKKTRIALAAIFFIAISLLFLGISGELTKWFGWMPKLQFLPAVLAVNVGIILLLVVITLLFGRCYCSVICPLGVYQDIVSWISSKRKGKKMRFSYKKEIKWLRYGIWVLFVAAIIAGVQVFVALLAPYSAYGRMLRTAVAPASTGTIIVAIVTFLVVTILAWIGGRTYCNTVCPVGTTLSFFSRFALFRPTIDADMCRGCRSCERQCKASCIDSANKKIDYSRCVDCFNCIDSCKFGGVKYRMRSFAGAQDDSVKKAQDDINKGRRAFMTSAAIAVTAATLEAQDKKVDGGLAVILDKQAPERTTPLTPFGSDSVKDFYKHCTACQLCVANCPNNVLRPSTSLEHFMYYLRPICRENGGNQWLPCHFSGLNYVQAVINGNTLTLTPVNKGIGNLAQTTEGVSASIYSYGTVRKVNRPLEVTLKVTKTCPADNLYFYLWANNSLVGSNALSLNGTSTGYVTISYTPTTSGTKNLKLTADKAGNYTYCTGSVDINPITSSNLSFTCSLVDPHLANVGYAIQARTKIKNDDANVYNDFIFAKLYKYTLAGAVKRVEMQQIGLDLSGGASVNKNFLFKGLEPGRYYVTLQYYNYNNLKLGVQSRDFQVGLGDVNGDGIVSSVDVTALYNYLLNNDDSAIVNGDLDGDGVITAGDIVIIYNILLGN